MPLIKGHQFAEDSWVQIDDEAPLPDDAAAIVSLARWQNERDSLAGRNAPIGVKLASHENPDAIKDDLDRFGVVVVEFPAFKDGRGFSYAHLMRRWGFEGEIRAVGHLIRDQLLFLERCGFDAIEVDERISEEELAVARGEFTVWYQPAADNRLTAMQLRHQSAPQARTA